MTDQEQLIALQQERDDLCTRIYALHQKIKGVNASCYIGKYFKKADSYDNNNIFYIYLKVLDVVKSGDIRVTRFVDDHRGCIEIHPDKHCPVKSFEDAEEITQDQFEAAWARCLIVISRKLSISEKWLEIIS